MKKSKQIDKNLLKNEEIITIDNYTETFINKIDFNNQGITINELFWLGIFIANQFCRCNATESRKRLHEINPQVYREIIEDNRLEKIEKAVNLYEKAIIYHRENFSPKDAFINIHDMGSLRESAVKALSNGVTLANREKDNEKKEKIKNIVNSLLCSINIDIDLYNAVLKLKEDNINNLKHTKKIRLLRQINNITGKEIG